MSEKILITGATGFIGKNLILRLATNKKYKIRCFVRKNSNTDFLKKLDIGLKYGDITNRESVFEAMKNVKKVVHLAALVGSSDPKLNKEINLEGSKNVLDACIKENIKQVIVVSSINAKLNIGTYGKTKLEAEKLFLNSNLNFTILRPCLVFGKDGRQFNSFIKSITDFPIIPLINNGKNKIQPVDVDDLTLVIEKMLKKGSTNNKIYEVGGATRLTTKEFVTMLCKEKDIKKIKIPVPSFIMIIAAKILGKRSPVNKDQIKFMTKDSIADIALLEKEFLIRFKTLEQVLRKYRS